MQIDNQDGLICITCGGIDSKKKADEFMAGLLQALQMRFQRHQNKELKSLRISLNQLNSYWTDGQLVAKEHSQSHYIEKQLRALLDGKEKEYGLHLMGALPLVAHSNNSINRATLLYGEDASSNLLNLDNFATKTLWLLEDLAQAQILEL